MFVPISWLKAYVELNLPLADLAERITLAGLEVTGNQQIGDWWDPETIRVGQIVGVHPHPDADRLVLVDVEYGGPEPEQVVTGAPNLFAYREAETLPVLKAPFARAGAWLIDAYSDDRPRPRKKLKPSKIRGVRSSGMVCSELELGLSEEHEGILLLPEDAPVGLPLREYLQDQIVEIDLTPDMARCLSMAGVAREVAALTGASLHLPADELQTAGDDQAADYVAVAIDDPELCNRYTALIIQDVQIGPSPAWMRQRLARAGMRPISNVVDITNYVMLELGQPLHAFDYDLLAQRAQASGVEKPLITVRSARSGESMTTLDGVERKLDESMLLITDSAGPIALAGVMGGAETEVHSGSRRILLESATFEGINNRRTAQELKLHSEASHRFTRGVPATLNEIAARRAAELMRLYAGGRVVPGMVDAYPVPQGQRSAYLTASEVRRQLGMDLSLAQIGDALRRLDFQVREVTEIPADAGDLASFGLHRKEGEPLLACTAPWSRLDISMPADLTEEVARVVGYESVGMTLMQDVLPPHHRSAALETEEQVRDILVGMGLQETISHTLTTPENHEKLALASETGRPYVELTNPLAPERRALRRTLLVSAMENMVFNLRYAPRLTTFEIGRVYHPEKSQTVRPHEERRLSLLLTGPGQLAHLQNGGESDEFDFFDLKGIVETLLDRLGFGEVDVTYEARPDTGAFGPRCAAVTVRGIEIGLLGEVHPQVRRSFGVGDRRVCLAELNLQPLVRPAWSLSAMAPISIYPPVVEDLAFEVTEEITNRRILDAIRAAGGEMVVDLELFDIYRGDPIPVGSKSLAYRLTYQSPNRSMGEKEINHLRQRIIRGVEESTGGSLRG